MKLVRTMYFVLLSLLVLLEHICCTRCSRLDLLEQRIFQDTVEFRKDIELILAKLSNISVCISDCLHERKVDYIPETKDKRTHLHVDDITEVVRRAMREENHARHVLTEEIADGKVNKRHIRNDLVIDTMFILCYLMLLPVLVKGSS